MNTLSHIIAIVWLCAVAPALGFIINPFRFAAVGGGNDPYFSSVVLLLHFDGSNGSTTITDNSSSTHTVTANGNAQISTSYKKFGSGAVLLDGVGDYLSVPDNNSLDLGSGDWTLEFWLKWTTLSGYQTIYDHGYVSAGGIVLQSGNSDGKINVYLNGSLIFAESSALGTNVWGYYQLVRSGSTVTLYRDGVSTGSGSNSTSLSSATIVSIGAKNDGSLAYSGNMDDLRVTKGVARTNAVPTAAFPDS